FLIARRRRQRGGDPGAGRRLEDYPAPEDEASAAWDREYEQRLFAWAAEQVRRGCQESTWRAFWLTAVEGRSGKEAARALGLTPGAVYLAKRRVMARLQEQLRQFRDD